MSEWTKWSKHDEHLLDRVHCANPSALVPHIAAEFNRKAEVKRTPAAIGHKLAYMGIRGTPSLSQCGGRGAH